MNQEIETYRSEWKEICRDYEIEENLRIRLHRCFSWASRISEHQENDSIDEAFLCAWVAFNSLFARIDGDSNEFLPEKESMASFMDLLLSIDRQDKLKSFLDESEWQMEEILQCKFLQQSFWKSLDGNDQVVLKNWNKDSFKYFRKKGDTVLLQQVLRGIYVMRNQLIHGGSTHGSQMNRSTLMLCLYVLEPMLNCFIDILIHEGSDLDLGPLPYPPLK